MRHLFVDDMYPGITKDSFEWKHLAFIMDKHQDLYVKLFIIANNYEPRMTTDDKNKYSIALHPQWCEWIDKLTDNPRITIGYHGCRHWNDALCNAEEFNIPDKHLIKERIDNMMRLFDISFKSIKNQEKIFKIPAHKCNPYLFEYLKELGFDYVSYHHGENHTDILPVVETDNKHIISSHIIQTSPSYIGKIGL
jgi:predicted deacetylase